MKIETNHQSLTSRLFFAALVLPLVVFVSCSSSDGGGSSNGNGTMTDDQATEYCEQFTQVYCEKCWACNSGNVCQAFFPGSSAGGAGCAAAAQTGCAEDDETDDGETCTFTREPTDSEIQACLNEVEQLTCDQMIDDDPDLPACEALDDLEVCTDDEPDAGSNDMGSNDMGSNDMGSNDMGSNEDTGSTDGGFQGTVNTEACEAAVAQTCSVLEACADDIEPRAPVQSLVDACAPAVASGESSVENLCLQYMEEALDTGSVTALWLNSASASDVAGCMSGDNCTEDFLRDSATAIVSAISTGETSEVSDLFDELLADCVD